MREPRHQFRFRNSSILSLNICVVLPWRRCVDGLAEDFVYESASLLLRGVGCCGIRLPPSGYAGSGGTWL